MDRISQLPQPIVHHILCFLSQDDAAKTCVLSKSWRYHWSTRPRVEFRESCFKGNRETFLAVLEKTLIRYHVKKLCIHKFLLEMSDYDSGSVLFLEKWVPIVILNMGVRTFHLSCDWYYSVPSALFQAKFLQQLYLKNCNLYKIDSNDELILLKNLKSLSLDGVHVHLETFEKIMSSCPLIEYLAMDRCVGLRYISVNKNHNLKDFIFSDGQEFIGHSVEIRNVPTLETIRITNCPNWYHDNYLFPYLKSLYLNNVQLSDESFDTFSSNFPCLEVLELHQCYGFDEFQLSSRSIKRLAINSGRNKPTKATVDAPNIVEFEYRGYFPPSISFTTSSEGWKSNIVLCSLGHRNFDDSSWLLELNKMIDALRQSKIYLDLYHYPHGSMNRTIFGDIYKPVVVERLHLIVTSYSPSYFSAFANAFFPICRPRILTRFWYSNAKKEWEKYTNRDTGFLCNIFQTEREYQGIKSWMSWRQDLEEVRLEAFQDNNKEQWRPVEEVNLEALEYFAALLPENVKSEPLKIRFLLKWKN